jgi:hypothetical protein
VTKDLDINSSCEFRFSRQALASALKVPVALAVIAAAFFDPDEPAVGITRLVGIVLIKAGVHARFARGLAGVFR